MLDNISPQIIIDGTLYTLIFFSIVTWTLILFKSWQFINNWRCNVRFEEAFWRLANLNQLSTLPDNIVLGSAARLAYVGTTWLQDHAKAVGKQLKHSGDINELLEQQLRVQLQKEQHNMEFGLTLLASIGSTSPFVGLFGTVLGIMHAMHDITASGSTSLDVVAGPIGDALIATAFGIAVAVPAVLGYNFALRQLKIQRATIENFVAGFMTVALNNQNTQG